MTSGVVSQVKCGTNSQHDNMFSFGNNDYHDDSYDDNNDDSYDDNDDDDNASPALDRLSASQYLLSYIGI